MKIIQNYSILFNRVLSREPPPSGPAEGPPFDLHPSGGAAPALEGPDAVLAGPPT